MKTVNAIAALLVAPLENQWDKCGQSIEDRDTLGAVTHFAFMIFYIMALTAAACGLKTLNSALAASPSGAILSCSFRAL